MNRILSKIHTEVAFVDVVITHNEVAPDQEDFVDLAVTVASIRWLNPENEINYQITDRTI